MTLLVHNLAPDDGGSTSKLSPDGVIHYTLPAPPGRWLNIREGVTFVVNPGPEDLDLPHPCAAGIVGGSLPEEQLGPGCSRPCPAGKLCPPVTTTPEPCIPGMYCPRNTPFAIPCTAGRYSNSTSLASLSGCDTCPAGRWCGPGTPVPETCPAGRFGGTTGQTN
eukprot:3018267-Prymnesium_polylepis.1